MKGILSFAENPLFLMGLSGFARASRGDDVTGGWATGADMASSLQSQRMRQGALDEEEKRKAAVQQFLSGPGVASLPPGLRDIAKITGDLGSVQSWITGADDRAWQAKSRARQETEWGRDDSTWAEDRSWTRKTRSQQEQQWAQQQQAAAEEKKARAAGVYANLYQMAGGDPEKLRRLEETARAAGFSIPAEFSGEGGGEAAMAISGRIPEAKEPEFINVPNVGLVKTQGGQASVAIGAPQKAFDLAPVDKKEIFESEDTAQASEAAIRSLDKALQLHEQAYSGLLANERSAIGGVFGAEGALATQELNNVIVGQALENLKAIFGAAPTEGERQLLLQIQGSVEQPAPVRKAILDRARQAAQTRMQLNRQRAQAIRSGQFYEPGYAPQAPAPEQSGGFGTIEEALQAAQPGSVIRDTATGKRYRMGAQGLEEVP